MGFRATVAKLLQFPWRDDVYADLGTLAAQSPAPSNPINERANRDIDTAAKLRALDLAIYREAESARQEQNYRANLEMAVEMYEAQQMHGAGPWLNRDSAKALVEKDPEVRQKLRETNPLLSQGAYGDVELALQNVEWRREINLSWLEFSRWGIQQIILISRLYYIKNPIVRRLIDISACYVFGRGVEVSSDDDGANEVLKDFFDANQSTLGQIALVDLERRKYYDGNLFWAFFTDAQNTGTVNVRSVDATEIQDIVNDPNDADTPWLYRRVWVARNFDIATGQIVTQSQEAWYPALGYNPTQKPATINSHNVVWDTPIYHRKCGGVAKWNFGCPIIYPALAWAKSGTKYLEACATIMQALSQIATVLTMKGGQTALEGAKQQLMTTVGPSSSLWDTNPPPVAGSIFASGPGTQIAAFDTKGGGQDPEKVRQYKLMCCMVLGVPETFLADVSTGNLATATTLDRPTELVFLERQEAWREDLVKIAKLVLAVSSKAPSGKLKESAGAKVRITEARRRIGASGRMQYVEAKKKTPGTIQIKATFPAIREGDIPELITAVADAMTLGNTAGQVVGIDEKAGVRKLYELVGIENGDELTEEQYPEKEYDPDRTKEDEPAPLPPAPPVPGGVPQNPEGQQPNTTPVAPPAQPTKPPEKPAPKESLVAIASDIRLLSQKLIEKRERKRVRREAHQPKHP